MQFLTRLLIVLISTLIFAPAYGADDCACESLVVHTACGDTDHDGCGSCSCSPFASCGECSGFIVSKGIGVDASNFIPAMHLDLCIVKPIQLPTVLNAETEPPGITLPKWKTRSPMLIRLRGSPIFS